MIQRHFDCVSKVWKYPGFAAWRFLNISKNNGTLIKRTFAKVRRGFGSLPVTVVLGSSTWNTSIFPDSKSGSYLLPLKAKIRKKENINDGARVKFQIEIRMLDIRHD